MVTILHLIPTLESGGAERQLAMLAQEQARRGYCVHIGLRRGGVYAEGGALPSVTIHRVENRRGPDPRLVRSMWRLIQSVRPDVVQTWLPQVDICGGIAARIAGVRWVMTERSSSDFYQPAAPRTVLRRWVARGADAIVANSRSGADYWRALDAPRRRVLHIANGVDAPAVQRAVRDAGPDGASGPLMLLAGRLASSKALDVALRAFAALGDSSVTLRVYGDGQERVALGKLAESLGIAPQVQWQRFSLDWWKGLATADVLVSLSRVEGAPNVVLEAMVAGVPLLVSDIPAHREIVDESTANLVPLDDVEAATRAMRAILSNPQGARARAARAAECVRTMTPDAMVEGYEALYRSLLGVTRA